MTISKPRRKAAPANTLRLEPVRRSALFAAFSCALDLAEGRPIGHAQRVAYIVNATGGALGYEPRVLRAAFYGALLHDVGVTVASAELYEERGNDEHAFGEMKALEALGALMSAVSRFPDIERELHLHVEAGARLVELLGFDEDVVETIRYHHAWWNGYGFPIGRRAHEIPAAARLVAFADLAEQLIAEEPNPLSARYSVLEKLSNVAGQVLDPVVARNFLIVCRDDRFWIELFSPELPGLLADSAPLDSTKLGERKLMHFAEAFSHIVDAKGGCRNRHSVRVADLAYDLARHVNLADPHARMVRFAGLLHDIGHLGIPNRVMSKPDIFTVEEMDIVSEHPRRSAEILEKIADFEHVARWIESHHEWMDGRGYPDGIRGDAIPYEARLIAIADTYDALTSERPHRPALDPAGALSIMENAAGTQLDPALFASFAALVERKAARAG